MYSMSQSGSHLQRLSSNHVVQQMRGMRGHMCSDIAASSFGTASLVVKICRLLIFGFISPSGLHKLLVHCRSLVERGIARLGRNFQTQCMSRLHNDFVTDSRLRKAGGRIGKLVLRFQNVSHPADDTDRSFAFQPVQS